MSLIPWSSWQRVVEKGPEWEQIGQVLERYGFGRLCVWAVAAGLNEYQLKGKAEVSYWPPLYKLTRESILPETLQQLEDILRPFYSRERLAKRKLERLHRFLGSELAGQMWTSEPVDLASRFTKIWTELARVMGQEPQDKTISFALKCLAIALIRAGNHDFDFSAIPIPVDLRVGSRRLKCIS